MRPLLFCLLAAAAAFAQTAVFPGGVAGDDDLLIAKNRVATTLAAPVLATATGLTVSSATGIVANMALTLGTGPEAEIVFVCQVSGTAITLGKSACPHIDGRGFDSTTARWWGQGRTVSAYITSWHHNALSAEVKALETWAASISVEGGAPSVATYITQTPNGVLGSEQALSTLPTGVLHNTTGTGVLSATALTTGFVPFGEGGGLGEDASLAWDDAVKRLRVGTGDYVVAWPYGAELKTPDRLDVLRGTLVAPVSSANPAVSIVTFSDQSIGTNLGELSVYSSRAGGASAIVGAAASRSAGSGAAALSGHVLMEQGTALSHASGFPLWLTCQLWSEHDNCSNEINPVNQAADAPSTGDYVSSGLSNALSLIAAGSYKSSMALYIGTQDTVNAQFRRGIDFQQGSISDYGIALPYGRAGGIWAKASGTNTLTPMLWLGGGGADTVFGSGGFWYWSNGVADIATLDNAGNLTLAGTASSAAALAANGTNCLAGQFARGVDASGNAEDCSVPAGGGDTLAPAANTNNYVPQWNGTNSKTLKDGLAVATANTASAIVQRDGSGNFSAGTITATLFSGDYVNANIEHDSITGAGVNSHAQIDAHISSANAHSATSANTPSRIVLRDPAGNFAAATITAALIGNASTATALAANGTNCAGGQAALGVDASGNAEGCWTPSALGDVLGPATNTGDYIPQWNGADSKTLKNGLAVASANTASAIVQRDGAGNFSAGTITAALTGNASTATALAANPAACPGGQFVNDIAADGTLTCAAPAGGGDVLGPAVHDDSYVPQWNGVSTKTLKAGLLASATAAAGALPLGGGGGPLDASWIPDISTTYQAVSGKNAANGYAGLSAGSKLTVSQGQEVWALADLTDVAAVTGTGTTVVLATAPSLTTPVIGAYTVAGLPAAGTANRVAIVTDAATAGSCTSGGGASRSWCRDTGAAWESLGGGAGAPGGSDTQLQWNNATAFGGTSGLTWETGDGSVRLANAPPGEATDALLLLGAAPVAANSSGTYFGVNAAGGYLGDFVRFQIGGVDKFRVDADGRIYWRMAITSGYDLEIGNAGDSGPSAVIIRSGNAANEPGYMALYRGGGNPTYLSPGNSDGSLCVASGLPGAECSNHVLTSDSTIAVSNKSLDNTNSFTDYLTGTEIAAPGSPAAGYQRAYIKTGSTLCVKNSAGTESCIPSGGGLADPGGNGLLSRTALNTTVNRTLTGTANEIAVTNGDGTGGNPTVALAATVDMSDQTATLPVKAGTGAGAPGTCTANKELYIKTDATAGQQLFICNAAGNGWVLVGDGNGGAGDLTDPGGNGVVVRTALNTTTNRTITGTADQVTVANGDGVAANPTLSLAANARYGSLAFVLDGGGSAITAGAKGWKRIPYSGTITSQELTCDASGDIVLDLWKDTYANFPPTVADTITAAAKPTLSGAQKQQDATLTGWTTALAAGDYVRLNVDSAATVTYCLLELQITRN